MKDFPFIILIVFFGLYLTLFISHYKIEEYRYNSMILSITETAQVAGFQSLDNSIRTNEGTTAITIDKFEKVFKEKFKENANVKIKNPKISFDYLWDDDGTIMAFRVLVKDDTDTEYQATLISDIAE